MAVSPCRRLPCRLAGWDATPVDDMLNLNQVHTGWAASGTRSLLAERLSAPALKHQHTEVGRLPAFPAPTWRRAVRAQQFIAFTRRDLEQRKAKAAALERCVYPDNTKVRPPWSACQAAAATCCTCWHQRQGVAACVLLHSVCSRRAGQRH